MSREIADGLERIPWLMLEHHSDHHVSLLSMNVCALPTKVKGDREPTSISHQQQADKRG